jgi:hypothetical protein
MCACTMLIIHKYPYTYAYTLVSIRMAEMLDNWGIFSKVLAEVQGLIEVNVL